MVEASYTGRHYEYGGNSAIDFVYLHKAIFPRAQAGPERCWLAGGWLVTLLKVGTAHPTNYEPA